jgi:response regulator of citrate/malate metabolism
MSRPNEYVISDDTELEFTDGSLTAQEKQWLESTGILRVSSYSSNSGNVNEAEIDFEVLARMAFEYDLLRSVASRVEIDILEVFRRSSENTLTTSEIAEETERPKSSISRALSQLVEKNKLTKVQAGVYRYPT